MKSKITKKVILDLTLDSSEMVMFNQGGQHKVRINPSDLLFPSNEADGNAPANDYVLEITVQLDRSQQGRHDWLTKESAAAINRRENEAE